MYRIAIAGCGSMANTWIEVTKKRDDCEICALVDVYSENAAEKKEKHGLTSAQIYTDLKTAISRENIDLVFDITPPQYHHMTSIIAMEAGCHVFSEKPLADSLEHSFLSIECSEKTGKSYFIMQNRRYVSGLCSLKDFLHSGAPGKVGQISADFRKNPHFGGFRDEMNHPLVSDMAIHTFDAARFVTGKNPISVFCQEFNPAWSWYKGDANALCIFEMEDGSIFDYRGSWCANGLNTSWESSWQLLCENGGAFWDGDSALYYEPAVDIKATGSERKREDISISTMAYEGHAACLTEMFSALSSNRRSQTDCRDNIKSVEMVYKAIESAKTGRKIFF